MKRWRRRGQLWREDNGSWSAVHAPAEWNGSPTSGRYIYGCPADTDELNARNPGRPESERLAAVAATYAAVRATGAQPARRPSYARTSSGARLYERCTHEDYPCCGCGE